MPRRLGRRAWCRRPGTRRAHQGPARRSEEVLLATPPESQPRTHLSSSGAGVRSAIAHDANAGEDLTFGVDGIVQDSNKSAFGPQAHPVAQSQVGKQPRKEAPVDLQGEAP